MKNLENTHPCHIAFEYSSIDALNNDKTLQNGENSILSGAYASHTHLSTIPNDYKGPLGVQPPPPPRHRGTIITLYLLEISILYTLEMCVPVIYPDASVQHQPCSWVKNLENVYTSSTI